MEKQEFVSIREGFEKPYQFGEGPDECESVSGSRYFRGLSLPLYKLIE